jgi:hypothetical protein
MLIRPASAALPDAWGVTCAELGTFMSDIEDEGYSLEMPFLPVTSNDGPYDDDAYVAGWQMGQLDTALAAMQTQRSRGSFALSRTIYTANRPQADLIAMRYGYTAEFEDNQDGTWTAMTLRPGDTIPDHDVY